MKKYSGGCLCEKVRYKISSPPISQGICYCRQCQRAGGMCGSPLLVLPSDAFDCQQDALSFCETKSDRGAVVRRHFCSDCGSHIFSRMMDIPTIVTVKVATLDDRDLFQPEYLVWTKSAHSSVLFPRGVPSFSEGAPLEMVLRV